MPSKACNTCGRINCREHRKTYRQRRGISSGSKASEINAAVLRRDGYRCTHRTDGVRCIETQDLEVHHVVSLAAGGTWSLDNLTTLCHAHHVEVS